VGNQEVGTVGRKWLDKQAAYAAIVLAWRARQTSPASDLSRKLSETVIVEDDDFEPDDEDEQKEAEAEDEEEEDDEEDEAEDEEWEAGDEDDKQEVESADSE
jgi:hypothetical protein